MSRDPSPTVTHENLRNLIEMTKWMAECHFSPVERARYRMLHAYSQFLDEAHRGWRDKVVDELQGKAMPQKLLHLLPLGFLTEVVAMPPEDRLLPKQFGKEPKGKNHG